jgi:hypothetical protein
MSELSAGGDAGEWFADSGDTISPALGKLVELAAPRTAA